MPAHWAQKVGGRLSALPNRPRPIGPAANESLYRDTTRQHVPAVDHAVAVPQPPEAGHLVARRSTVKVYDDVVVGDQ